MCSDRRSYRCPEQQRRLQRRNRHTWCAALAPSLQSRTQEVFKRKTAGWGVLVSRSPTFEGPFCSASPRKGAGACCRAAALQGCRQQWHVPAALAKVQRAARSAAQAAEPTICGLQHLLPLAPNRRRARGGLRVPVSDLRGCSITFRARGGRSGAKLPGGCAC